MRCPGGPGAERAEGGQAVAPAGGAPSVKPAFHDPGSASDTTGGSPEACHMSRTCDHASRGRLRVIPDGRRPRQRRSCRHDNNTTHIRYPRDPAPAAQSLESHAGGGQRGPRSLLRDPPRGLPCRLRRPHAARRRRHPHLRRRRARHAGRGQGGLDRDCRTAQPTRPPVAADRARLPRRGRCDTPLTGHALATR